MNCSCNGCSQIVIDRAEQKREQPLCYFHAKQRDGLIPIEDREYYLSSTDMQDLGKDLERAKGWSKFGLRYRPWVFKAAYKLAYRYGVDAGDLAQEGLAFAWSLGAKIDMSRPIAEQVSYFKQCVKGRMLEYISQIGSVLRLTHWQFKKNEIKIQSLKINDERWDLGTALDPETCLIQQETEQDQQQVLKRVGMFNDSLSRKERIVFQKSMIAKHPMTTRDLARKIGVKSPQTVVNIQNKIIEKAKGFFYESNDS